jgi:hypothetical protein
VLVDIDTRHLRAVPSVVQSALAWVGGDAGDGQ